MSRRIERLVLASFFLSGFAALVYEVCWMRLAGLYFESTVHSIATVVGIFMGGLALGGRLAGRVARGRGDLTLLYFNLEALIGLLALLVPLLFTCGRPLFGAIYRGLYELPPLYHAARVLLCAVILLPATTLMGLTLPVLVQVLARERLQVGVKSGLLYGVNCGGAALGAFLCGFVLLPQLGILRTTLAGAVVNLGLAAVGWSVLRRFPWGTGRPAQTASVAPVSRPVVNRPAASSPATERHPPRERRDDILIAFALSGFCSLCYQIIWTRVLIANIGPAAHSFAIILSCFILGLAIGGAAYAAISPRLRDPGYACGVLMLLAGLAATLTSLLLPRLPALAARSLEGAVDSFGELSAVRYGLAAIIILPLTIFSGALFPAAAAAYAPDAERLAGRVGRLYAANGVGSIAGSLAGGFILLPGLGAHRAGVPIVALQFAVGLLVVQQSRGMRPALSWAPLPAVALAILLFSPAADPKALFGGSYLYFKLYNQAAEEGARAHQTLLYHEDGPSGTVTVLKFRRDPTTFFAIDGKTDGSSSGADMTTQTMLAHLPMLLHPRPAEVLVIGLGTGTSFATTLRYPLRRSTCVEISPQVVEASAFFHSNYGGDPLRDPRARLRVGDGRSLVLFEDERFDVIIAEPSNPWMSGTGNLFTREYFQAARRRLGPDGVFCQWLHGYRMRPATFRDIVHTFSGVFPHVSLWWISVTGGDFILLGTNGEQRFDLERLERDLRERDVCAYVQRDRSLDAPAFLRSFVASDDVLHDWSAGARVLTDDNTRLEHTASREMYVDALAELRGELVRIAQPATVLLDEADAARPGLAAKLAALQENRTQYAQSLARQLDPDQWGAAFYQPEHAAWRDDEEIAIAVAAILSEGGGQAYREGLRQRDPGRRHELLQRGERAHRLAREIDPADPRHHAELAADQRALGDHAGCAETVVAARQRGLFSGRLLQVQGELLNDLALADAQQAENLAGIDAEVEGARLRERAQNRLREAEAAFRQAVELEPDSPVNLHNLAIAEFNLGRAGAARDHLRKAISIDPSYGEAVALLRSLEK